MEEATEEGFEYEAGFQPTQEIRWPLSLGNVLMAGPKMPDGPEEDGAPVRRAAVAAAAEWWAMEEGDKAR